MSVPNVIGMTKDEAKAAIEEAGLVYVDAGSEKSSKKKDTIIKVEPKEGEKVKKGSKVRVIISLGKNKTVKMPNFTESTLETVKAFLDKNNIKNVNYEEQYSSTISEGYVISTTPEAGTKIDSDTEVTVYVSKGPKTVYITVPNVVGWSYENAQAELVNKGFKVSKSTVAVTDKSQNNVVQSQTNRGENLAQGSTITLTVGVYTETSSNSSGNNNNSNNNSDNSNNNDDYNHNDNGGNNGNSDNDKVPNVVGLSLEDATNELESAGFQCSASYQPTNDKSQNGLVISQSNDGKKVTITVAQYNEQ